MLLTELRQRMREVRGRTGSSTCSRTRSRAGSFGWNPPRTFGSFGSFGSFTIVGSWPNHIPLTSTAGARPPALSYAAGTPRRALLVLGHGAGAGQRHPFMVGAAEGFAARGIDVVTFDFPYMHERRHVPDKAPVLEQCFRSVITASRAFDGLSGHRLFIGGKSMGGRIATHLGAQGSTA